MPVSRAYTIEDTIEAMRFYVKATGRRVVFEYALIDQKNDTPECAQQLADLIRGMQCHVKPDTVECCTGKRLQRVRKGKNKKIYGNAAG